MHPRVVRAQLAQADQPQGEVRVVPVRAPPASSRPREPPARQAARACRRAGSSCAARPPGSSSPSTMPCGLRRSSVTLRRPRRSPNQSPPGPARRIRSTSRSGDRRTPAFPAQRSSRRLEGTTPARREICVDDLPLLPRLAGRLDHRVGHLDERRGEEAEERQREVLALVHGGRRQHEVAQCGMCRRRRGRSRRSARGRTSPPPAPPPLGTERTGFPAETKNARICPLPGVVISFAITEAGRLPSTSGRSPIRERTRSYVARFDHARQPLEVDRRVAEHGTALAVEVAGDQVERVEQERDHRRVPAEARAGAPVDGGALGAGEVPREPADLARVDAGVDLGLLRRDGPSQAPAARPPRGPVARSPRRPRGRRRRSPRASRAAGRRRSRGGSRRARTPARSRSGADRRRPRARRAR